MPCDPTPGERVDVVDADGVQVRSFNDASMSRQRSNVSRGMGWSVIKGCP
jgi:hypothetical protein